MRPVSGATRRATVVKALGVAWAVIVGGCVTVAHVAVSAPGGVVVRNRRLQRLRGRYLYADFYRGQLRSFVPHRRHARGDRAVGIHVDHPSSFGTGAHNRVYVTSLDGPVYRLLRR